MKYRLKFHESLPPHFCSSCQGISGPCRKSWSFGGKSLPPHFCSSCLGSPGTSQKSQSRVRCTVGWCRHTADQRHKFLNGLNFVNLTFSLSFLSRRLKYNPTYSDAVWEMLTLWWRSWQFHKLTEVGLASGKCASYQIATTHHILQ
jgi:hypothetical protein